MGVVGGVVGGVMGGGEEGGAPHALIVSWTQVVPHTAEHPQEVTA